MTESKKTNRTYNDSFIYSRDYSLPRGRSLDRHVTHSTPRGADVKCEIRWGLRDVTSWRTSAKRITWLLPVWLIQTTRFGSGPFKPQTRIASALCTSSCLCSCWADYQWRILFAFLLVWFNLWALVKTVAVKERTVMTEFFEKIFIRKRKPGNFLDCYSFVAVSWFVCLFVCFNQLTNFGNTIPALIA